MLKLFGRVVFAMLLTMALSSIAQATSCMVMGEKTAVVHTENGNKSPVFLSEACEELRLVSGKALVSWVARDGKPHFVPIGPNGVEQLPSPGGDERPANSVWAELTSKRDAQRSAYMRDLGNDNATRFYVPTAGMILAGKTDTKFRLIAVQDSAEHILMTQNMTEGTPVTLASTLFEPGAVYLLEWMQGEQVESWRIRLISAPEQAMLDQHTSEIKKIINDEDQRAIMLGMLYEQHHLPFNLRLSLSTTALHHLVPAETVNLK